MTPQTDSEKLNYLVGWIEGHLLTHLSIEDDAIMAVIKRLKLDKESINEKVSEL